MNLRDSKQEASTIAWCGAFPSRLRARAFLALGLLGGAMLALAAALSWPSFNLARWIVVDAPWGRAGLALVIGSSGIGLLIAPFLERSEREAHQLLVESESKYRDLYEHSPDMLVSVDAATRRVVDCNQTALTSLGYARDEFIGKHSAELFHVDNVKTLERGAEQFFAQGEVRDIELDALRKDGSRLLVIVNATAVRDAHGTILRSRGVWRDISAQRRAEQLRQRDQFFQLTVDLVCVAGREGRFIQVNPSCQRVLGYSQQEFLSHDFLDFVHPDDRDATLRAAERGKEVKTLDFVNRYRCKDGSYRWLQWRSEPDRDGLNYAVARDITEQKELEERLRQSEERFRLLVEDVHDYAIVFLDASGCVATWNKGAERLMGFQAAEILGKHASMFYTAEDRERGHLEASLAHAAREGRHEEEGPRLRKGGALWWPSVVITALRAPQGHLLGYGIVCRDFTERRKVERELIENQARLSAIVREREALLQEVHHRVKNNLQVVSSMLRLRARRVNDAMMREVLRDCQTRVAAIALVHQLLYRSSNLEMMPFHAYARELTGQVLRATGAAQRGISVHADVEPISLSMDEAVPCGLILNELITNAVKHAFPTVGGGRIEVSFRREGAEFALTVRDDGAGLSDPEATTQSMGLSLVQGLTQQVGGTFTVTSGPGACFQVRFPANAQQQRIRPPEPSGCTEEQPA